MWLVQVPGNFSKVGGPDSNAGLVGPTTGAVDITGHLLVLDAGTRIVDVGTLGANPPIAINLHAPDGAGLPAADQPERIAISSYGQIIGSNRNGLYTIDRKTGAVSFARPWPEKAPLPEFGPKGSVTCCDIVHLQDPLGFGAWLVAPAGRPVFHVLDEDTFETLTTWPLPVVEGDKVLAIRQLKAVLSTGYIWLVAQTSPEPNYKGRVVVLRYPLFGSSAGAKDLWPTSP